MVDTATKTSTQTQEGAHGPVITTHPKVEMLRFIGAVERRELHFTKTNTRNANTTSRSISTFHDAFSFNFINEEPRKGQEMLCLDNYCVNNASY